MTLGPGQPPRHPTLSADDARANHPHTLPSSTDEARANRPPLPAPIYAAPRPQIGSAPVTIDLPQCNETSNTMRNQPDSLRVQLVVRGGRRGAGPTTSNRVAPPHRVFFLPRGASCIKCGQWAGSAGRGGRVLAGPRSPMAGDCALGPRPTPIALYSAGIDEGREVLVWVGAPGPRGNDVLCVPRGRGGGVLSLEKGTNCRPTAGERWLRTATAKKGGLSFYNGVG